MSSQKARFVKRVQKLISYILKYSTCLLILLFLEFGSARSDFNNNDDPVINEAENNSENIKTYPEDIPAYQDFVYQLRLSTIQSSIPFTYNDDIRRWIEVYVARKRNLTERILGLSKVYYPLFDEIFAKHGIPSELKHLAVIESALNHHAVSKTGATGIWQFMYWTGKEHGLEINYYIDDRKDPYKSTEAAAKFLKSLYKKYNDWLLVIAAYNCGPGNVNKAIRYSGGKKDYWKIRKYLPRETRVYVPAFIAANYVMNYAYEHNLHAVLPEIYSGPFNHENIGTIGISKNLSFDALGKFLQMSVEEIAFFNPSYKRNIFLPANGNNELRLPCDKIDIFNNKQDSILLLQSKLPSPEIIYTVKPGDNLYYISKKYNCSTSQIIKWNNLSNTIIHPNQKLILYGYKQSYNKINANSMVKKQITTAQKNINEEVYKSRSASKYVYYIINPGDTLWNIAQKYSGVTVENLIKANKILDVTKVQAGSVIKIQVTG